MRFWFVNISIRGYKDDRGNPDRHCVYTSKDKAIEYGKRYNVARSPHYGNYFAVSVQEAKICSDRLLLMMMNYPNNVNWVNEVFNMIRDKNPNITLSEPTPILKDE